ncbi:unnamed protein product [Meganyctiphanes norvegica]|uniref:Uncharacterized protein n=1 Tax=Meganyctiphanes norvegica TaxID=48144 RepID=A0AAV2RCE1_MEGNR
MQAPTTDKIKEVQSQLKSIMDTPVGTQPYICLSLRPTLVKLAKIEVCHPFPPLWSPPAFRKLYNWFAHPKRTANEFNYVLGPLRHDVKLEKDYYGGYPLFLGQAAAEALAVKSPVLEGSWELTAWLVVRAMRSTDPKYHSFGNIASNRLSAWIIQVIGNADICPNAYLRFELLTLLRLVRFDTQFRTRAVEAIMSAYSSLNTDYLSVCYFDDIPNNFFDRLFYIFGNVMGDWYYTEGNGCLFEFGEKLAKN